MLRDDPTAMLHQLLIVVAPMSFVALFQVHVGRDRMDELTSVLLCSEHSVIRMARSFPALLSMEPEDVFYRMLALKVRSQASCLGTHLYSLCP